jgi:hypothetical protein
MEEIGEKEEAVFLIMEGATIMQKSCIGLCTYGNYISLIITKDEDIVRTISMSALCGMEDSHYPLEVVEEHLHMFPEGKNLYDFKYDTDAFTNWYTDNIVVIENEL